MRPLESGGAGALAQERGGTRANAEHEREWEVEGDGLGEGVLEVVDGGGGERRRTPVLQVLQVPREESMGWVHDAHAPSILAQVC